MRRRVGRVEREAVLEMLCIGGVPFLATLEPGVLYPARPLLLVTDVPASSKLGRRAPITRRHTAT